MLISVVIPCKKRDEDVENLIRDINEQVLQDKYEIIVIEGIFPVSKARNEGAKRAKGEVLVFIDQDIRLGNMYIIERLVKPLSDREDVGITVTSLKIPPDGNSFEKQYAKEMPLSELPVLKELTGIGTAPSACCAISAKLFNDLHGFREEMSRGEDSEFSLRLRNKGYKIMMSPETWCYHHQPQNFIQLVTRYIRNGLGVAYIDTYYPELNIDIHPHELMFELNKKSILYRICRFIKAYIKALAAMRLLYMSSRIIYIFAYFYGIIKYKVFGRRTA